MSDSTTPADAWQLLTPKQVAQILAVDPRTLQAWRLRKQGPAFVRLGTHTVRYRQSDIEAFISKQS